mgnify:FL=1
MAEGKNSQRSLLLIGDLSFYHDMNGLLASQHGMDLTIVVINNGGGGIFSFLPIANTGMDTFSKYWTTNTYLNFKKAADLYKCQYDLIKGIRELKVAIETSFTKKGIKIIEVKTIIADNVKSHHNFQKKVEQILVRY